MYQEVLGIMKLGRCLRYRYRFVTISATDVLINKKGRNYVNDYSTSSGWQPRLVLGRMGVRAVAYFQVIHVMSINDFFSQIISASDHRNHPS
jgi:hypothetical protein